MVSGVVSDNNIKEVYMMKKLKNFIYGLICAAAATITTYKILTIYFYYVSQTNEFVCVFIEKLLKSQEMPLKLLFKR